MHFFLKSGYSKKEKTGDIYIEKRIKLFLKKEKKGIEIAISFEKNKAIKPALRLGFLKK